MGHPTEEKILFFDMNKCTGCKVCELACSMAKGGEYNPAKSFIRVLRNWEMDVNIVALDLRCDYCNECVAWCAPKALRFLDPEEAAIKRMENGPGVFPAPRLRPGEFRDK